MKLTKIPKSNLIAFTIIILFVLSSCANNDKNKMTDRIIAHAGGAIDLGNGFLFYTNSKEALDNSYKNGFRLFELDIIKTSDNVYVAAHDWNDWQKRTNYKGKLPPSLQEFKSTKIYDKLTPLDINDINEWFSKHKDAVFITDKINEPKEFSNSFVDKKRLKMELFSKNAILEAKKIKIDALVTGVLARVLTPEEFHKYDVKYVAASRHQSKKELAKFHKMGIKTYLFHIELDKETQILCETRKYSYGIYAEKFNFETSDFSKWQSQTCTSSQTK